MLFTFVVGCGQTEGRQKMFTFTLNPQLQKSLNEQTELELDLKQELNKGLLCGISFLFHIHRTEKFIEL